jgi:glycyl-tRNA synthetase beta chain
MPDLLLELFSEEIPARMQAQAAKDLERLVVGVLSDRGLLFEAAKSFAGPRRLTLAIAGLPAKQPDVKEERKGPRVGAPDKAIDGFLRSAGVTLDECQKQSDGKGEFYVAVIEHKGRATAEVLSEILPETFAKLPWPKSMRWPQKIPPRPFGVGPYGKGPFGTNAPVRWVRPLHGIVCTFDGDVVPFEFAGVTSGNVTHGHRFLSKGPIEVRRFEDYEEKLRRAHVILDAAERKEIILHDARNKAFAQRLELVEDAGLLEEVAGLAEWPVVLIGSIEDEFMSLPPEILQTSMRTHQKYFALRVPPLQGGGPSSEAKMVEGARLAPKFVVVANMLAEDGGKEIVAGNERVLRARLSDAKFFWDQDRKRTLESRVDDLKNIVFHAKLGTQYERVERIEALAGVLAKARGFDPIDVELVRRAARICKCDLTTGVVGEFPELQGLTGYYYALNDNREPAIADAIRDHYRPLGPSDAVPKAPTSLLVALADKLDSLVAFFAVGEKPTGSSDPFALRRAALGAIRIILESKLRIGLRATLRVPALFALVHANVAEQRRVKGSGDFDVYKEPYKASAALMSLAQEAAALGERIRGERPLEPKEIGVIDDVLGFFADRLKVALREKGTRHDLIDAVFSLGNEDDLVRLVARVEALQAFLKTDDGANLLVAYSRAANILRDEEKRDKTTYDGEPDPELLSAPEEKALFVELATASELIRAEVERERFVEAMGVMARLRKPVDAFFDKVTVNDKDPELRKNRLKLLSRLRATLHLVADFSKIEG